MASVPLQLGWKFSALKNGQLTSKIVLSSKFGYLNVFAAGISSRTSRANKPLPPKPAPWPYKEKGFKNWHYWCLFERTIKRFDENTKMIIVEGPPACGKTEFAQALAEELEFHYLPMVTSDYHYIDERGFDLRDLNKYLSKRCEYFDEEMFLKNPYDENATNLIALLYQLKVRSYIDALAHIFNTGQGVVFERSPYADIAFADANLKLGYINKEERKAMSKMREVSLPELRRPHLVIYLDASVDTVLENFKKRGKGEENIFPREYLETLEEAHKKVVLPELEQHAEVISYEWDTPGEVDFIVDDIEKIEFDMHWQGRDPKMSDWRFFLDETACGYRWKYTNHGEHLIWKMSAVENYFDCPRWYINGTDYALVQEMLRRYPGYRYPKYHDPVLDKTSPWRVFEPETYTLPQKVTDYLLGTAPKPVPPMSLEEYMERTPLRYRRSRLILW